MLILTRKYRESIVINGLIVVTFLGMNDKGEGKLGFEAPDDVTIWRQEIHDKMKYQDLEEI